MNINRTFFLTGATGMLGSYLLKILIEKGHKVYVLARSLKDRTAKDRVENVLKFWDKDILDKVSGNIKIIEGDITFSDLGLSKKDKKELISEVEIIFHSAALAEFRAPLDLIRKINVEGTRNVLDLALECRKLKKINHISTVYVAGATKDICFTEDMLDFGQTFNNTYEQSKFEAEKLVNLYLKKDLNISIFRPSMIIGDSIDGKTNSFKLIYEPLHFLSLGIFERFPANLDSFYNLINVDTVAKAIYFLGEIREKVTYHVVSSENITGRFLLNYASNYFGFKLPEFINLEDFHFEEWTLVQRNLAMPFVPYFNYTNTFASKRTSPFLKSSEIAFKNIDEDILFRIFNYCDERGFVRKKIWMH